MRKNNTTNRERAQVRRGDGREIGGIVNDVFRKRVDATRHFLRKPYPAIAFDLDSISRAKELGARQVEVIDRESGKVYRASIATIWERGFSVNRGHGAQIALALNEWTRDDAPTVDQQKLF